MRLVVLLFSILGLVSCAKKENSNYVQTQDITLEQPRVKANHTIIDSSVTVTSELRMEGVDIFYTNDGTIPSKASTKYQKPLDIKNEGVYKFRAFHKDYKPSPISELKLYKKGYTPNSLKWETKASRSYPSLGESTLLNNKKGSLNFKDTQWFGFDTTAIASVKFEKETTLKSVTIGYLIDTKSWIFPPEKIILIVNKKDTISKTISALKNKEINRLDDVKILINKEVTSLSIFAKNTKKLPEWHPGKGLKAWLFMDEWIFN